MHQSILIYKRFLYLKLALLAIITAIVAYSIHAPLGAPNGGTWLGYTLGGLSAFLVVWLMWFGIRKRRYAPGNVNLEAWLSAHVYFGLTLIILATLHTGFQFGLNVHTLAYALMILVILSGMFGVYSYIRYPREMTENRDGVTLDEMMLQIADLDRQCREIAMKLSEEINATVFEASRNTRVGGGLFRQLAGHDSRCPTTAALGQVEALAATTIGEDAAHVRRLVSLLSRECELLRRARKDVRFQALMQVWLFIHVPLSFALFAALIAHVFAVFFYW
ncbi:MAG: hypothetical protein E2O65_12085 [Gammaproteobacteria bacterium]|nr:MAG: hypothetical protein E2O65_12085 [Gammaproteobacteria bacterium]